MLRSLSHIVRLIRTAAVLARHRALVPAGAWDRAPAPLRRFKARESAETRTNHAHGLRLAKALESLGPSYIKLGQLLATRSDLVGAPLAESLSSLHDKVPPFEIRAAEAMIEADFGHPARDLFGDLGAPVAAASIAQVHKAVVDWDGAPRTVAVKILRPGVEAAFKRDVDSFYTAARLALRLRPGLKRLRPVEVVRTLDESVEREMDLRMEAAAASELAERTADDETFRVPRIDWQRTSRHVMTSEWIDGIALSDRAGLDTHQVDKPRLARLVLQSFLRQAMRDGVFHADMHPGNLFVDGEGRLVAVDFGIMGRLDRSMRRFMAETLYGFITRDYERVADVHFEAGFVPATRSRDDFAQAIRAIGEPIWGRPVQEMSIGRLLTQLFETTRRFDMPLQPQLILLQKTMVAAEGVARDLDPNLSIWDCAKPIVEEWLESEIGAEARLRDAAQAVQSVGRIAARAPDLIADFEAASRNLSDLAQGRGLRLHPDSLKAIRTERPDPPERSALWVMIGLNLAMLGLLLLT